MLVYRYEESILSLGEFNSGRCSCTLINGTTVLTAAHCLTRSGDVVTPIPPNHFRVCSFGNLSAEGENVDCALVESVHVAPGWRGDGFPEHDFGVLKLREPISGASTMSLTSQPPGRWNDSQIKNTAYPALRSGLPIDCDDLNEEVGEVQTAFLISYETNTIITESNINGANQYTQMIINSDVTRLAQILRFKADGGGGHSGSPIYLCPGLDCNSNPEIIGIWTNWNPILQKREGPRVGQFRDFVNDLL